MCSEEPAEHGPETGRIDARHEQRPGPLVQRAGYALHSPWTFLAVRTGAQRRSRAKPRRLFPASWAARIMKGTSPAGFD